jgi:hypothetical protein
MKRISLQADNLELEENFLKRQEYVKSPGLWGTNTSSQMPGLAESLQQASHMHTPVFLRSDSITFQPLVTVETAQPLPGSWPHVP